MTMIKMGKNKKTLESFIKRILMRKVAGITKLISYEIQSASISEEMEDGYYLATIFLKPYLVMEPVEKTVMSTAYLLNSGWSEITEEENIPKIKEG